jgi:hypothetical protein
MSEAATATSRPGILLALATENAELRAQLADDAGALHAEVEALRRRLVVLGVQRNT